MSLLKKIKSLIGLGKEKVIHNPINEEKKTDKAQQLEVPKATPSPDPIKKVARKIRNKIYFRKPQPIGTLFIEGKIKIHLVDFLGMESWCRENKNVYSRHVFKSRLRYVYEYMHL